jgi:hypothetical protein
VAVSAFALPFREQAEFLRRKLNITTEAWTDLYGPEHDRGFMVAGANRDDLVADFHSAVQKAIDQGETIQSWRKDFDAIVKQHGWSYNGGRNWRSRVIYETNLNSSYMAGRFQQLMEARAERPYWQYLHSIAVEDPREEHLAWNGLILRWDDPWWQTHFPVNAWGCQCRVNNLSEADLVRMGRTVDTAPPIEWEERLIGQRSPGGPRLVRVPKGIDPGFEYTPGRSLLDKFVPGDGNGNVPPPPIMRDNLVAPLEPLPPPRPMPDALLSVDVSADDAIDLFLSEFGATRDEPVVWRDALDEALAIGKAFFYRKGTTELKLTRDRIPSVLLLAQTIKAPDEIWNVIEWNAALQKSTVRRRYIAQFEIEGKTEIMVFELDGQEWILLSTFGPNKLDGLEQRVRGVPGAFRIYRRDN